jgi:DNA-directed RNA polymerase subunit beta'
MVQRRVLGASTDVVGRSTVTPDPDLGMDEVGLPEPKAWTIYRPFIIRNLVRKGMPPTVAVKAVAAQSEVARNALLAEMETRPVLINRAPTLHRYGFMAAWPKLTKGLTLRTPPVIAPSMSLDHDGDAMNYHVPVSDDAVKEAIEKMMPSRNLRSVRDFKVHYLPKNEFQMGLYLAGGGAKAADKGGPRVFANAAAAEAAYHRGELGIGDRVVVKG